MPGPFHVKTHRNKCGNFINESILCLTHLFVMLMVFGILVPWLPLKVKSPILQIFESFQHSSGQTVYSPDGEAKHETGINNQLFSVSKKAEPNMIYRVLQLTLVSVLQCTSYIQACWASHKATEQLERWSTGGQPTTHPLPQAATCDILSQTFKRKNKYIH